MTEMGEESAKDCEELWSDLEKETKAIAEIEDPIARNKIITGKYAEMFKKNNKLVWSGAAAFASKQVGCGLNKAKEAFDSWLRPKSSMAETLYNALGAGNEAVFSEIYPVLEFYNEHGLDKLQECADERGTEPVPPDLLDAFEKLEAGDLAGAAEDMLRYEQYVTLEEVVYANEDVAGILRMNQTMSQFSVGKALGAEDTKLAFTGGCNGGKEVFFKGKDLSNFTERWPFAKEVATTFQEMLTTHTTFIDIEMNYFISVGRAAAGGGG